MERQFIRPLPALAALAAAVVPLVASTHGWAGQAEPWQVWHQDPSTPVMEQIESLHRFLAWISAGIVVLVMALLGYVIWRFNEKRNPVPARFSHNQLLEFAWTAFPVAILVIIAIPSFKLLYFMDRAQEADMTLKVTGHQWYWSYEYPDHGGFMFDSFMKDASDLQPGEPRLLAVDNEVVLPVGTTVRVVMTSNDVIHSWAVPALGVKTDNVPGRLTETWLRLDKPGVFYGQCSELCGVNHGFMPIAIRGVPPEEFEQWVGDAQERFAKAPRPQEPGEARLAQAAN
ncbi:cytochrome c oxidase subunit II [Novispirillum sp. DQ9]|uniref:cytochrome c oxidase subunit II n=1 Tax=Novispirillum sp. DQ9 TaxID=3398612 RepID=UPI003C7D4552